MRENKEVVDVELICTGRELLIGKTINTNAAWIGRQVHELGGELRRRTVIGDNVKEVSNCFKEAINRKPYLIISTGGLGPTPDDSTLKALATALKQKLVLNKEALRMIKDKYGELGLKLTVHREKMAMLPEKARPLKNPVGTAPGCLVKQGETLIIALPGVPSEMKEMFKEHVAPLLKQEKRLFTHEESFEVRGIPESSVAPVLEEIRRIFPAAYVKSHPKGTEKESLIEIHIIVQEKSEFEAWRKAMKVKETLKRLLKNP